MSVYNIVNGFNPSCIWILPMLGKYSDDYPEFRDCFLSEDRKRIVIYTRKSEVDDAVKSDPNFVTTYEDADDATYRFYEFNCPDKWKSDFDLIIEGKTIDISEEYRTYLKEFYPEFADHFDVHRHIQTQTSQIYTG